MKDCRQVDEMVAPDRFLLCHGLLRFYRNKGHSRLLMAISKTLCRDFPGGPEVKNPPCNGRDVGLIPGWGIKIPQASEQPSP